MKKYIPAMSLVALAVQHDLVGTMHDPVEGYRTQQHVVESIVPFRGVQVAGDELRPPLVTIRDDVMEVPVLFGAHGLEAAVVDDVQICFGQRRQFAFGGAHDPRRGELAEKLGVISEYDVVAATYGDEAPVI